MTSSRKTVLRLVVAAMLAIPSVAISVSSSSAAPSKAQVEAAKAKLDALNRQLDQMVEQYNQAQVRLQQTQAKLLDAKQAKDAADAITARATSELSKRAVAAYTGMGSQLDVLLGAASFTEFSDRLQFMGALAQDDADLAAQAQIASQKSQWAAQQYAQAVTERQTTLNELANQKSQIEAGISDQEALYSQMSTSYKNALAAQAAAAAAAAASTSSGGSSGSGGGSVFVPPQNASAAQVAIAAAESVIGTTYVFGSADPGVGFDCSGLVMWSYSQAGIALPHSSAMMSEMLPRLSESELLPGDLMFFYSPVSHVAIYLGGGSMIDASHPGPGGEVAIRPVYWQYFDWGGRIG
ncbi:MAG: C40 family peptidase [Actinomycetota bacterium]